MGVALMAQTVSRSKPWSVRMAESEMIRTPKGWQLDFSTAPKWNYCHGLVLQSMMDVYDRYGDKKFYDYALAYADTMVQNDGSIMTYKVDDYTFDRLNSGRILFRIYEQEKQEKYKKAMDLLRTQFDGHPRNNDGGFWHKKVYENQVWLDGVYMSMPYYAEYAFRNNDVDVYQDIVNQFRTVAKHTYDAENDVYRHACDVSKRQKWADPVTGQSQHCWGRAMGWFAMACVDVLDFMPEHEPGREEILAILEKLVKQIKARQDAKTGVWYQVIDRSGDEGNYLEATCSTMFVYTLLKAVRNGYIDPSYKDVAEKGYRGILKEFVKVDENGIVSIEKCCAVAGLGGKNNRSGDYQYYLNEPIRANDPKAVGPFILASLEWERDQKEPISSVNPLAGDTLVVARDGTGHYRTLAAAIERVRVYMDYDVTIYVKKGVFKEKIIVPEQLQNLEIVGEDRDETIITFDDHANINKMGTFRTYTLKVNGNNLVLRNLTIENNAPQLGQAVALHTEGDCVKFINCRFLGNQDTIYTGGRYARLYFKDCYIEGTTDFIFGPATALFENCHIHCKRNSYITAASTPKEVKYGYVFKKCRITTAENVTKMYLGRPWRPYAYTLFMECELDKNICPEGWHNWGNVDNEKTARYLEYNNIGEGASVKERVKWSRQLTKKEAAEITVENLFMQENDWVF
jgi:unsaturated rhamnogalacturonyl hydrolase